jgi:twitching motility two-component system response regulator PilG
MRGVDPPFAQRLRVLVVDDSPTVRRQLSVAFDRMGIASEAVDSAAAALEQLAVQHFDLALLDIVMPDMDGYRLTREIRRNRALRQLPIIILTSRSSPFDLARGALAGCDTYLTKPVPYRALEAAVRKQLRRALAIDDLGALVRIPPQAGESTAAPTARPGLVARLFGRS